MEFWCPVTFEAQNTSCECALSSVCWAPTVFVLTINGKNNFF